MQAGAKSEMKLLNCPMYRAVYDTYKNMRSEKGKRTAGKEDPQVSSKQPFTQARRRVPFITSHMIYCLTCIRTALRQTPSPLLSTITSSRP